MDALVGIPGTISQDVKQVRWRKLKESAVGKEYVANVPDGILKAIVSQDPAGTDGRLLWHISVSHRNHDGIPRRVPTWDELKHAAYRLVQPDVPLVLIFPRRSAPYVSHYETCLHLWEAEQNVDL